MNIGRWIFMCWIGGRMARELHKNLLARVVKAPVNLFFDVTPIAKLLDNFTSDIGRTDRAFFRSINGVMSSVIDCLIKIGIAMYFSPFMIVAVVTNLYFLRKLQKYTLTAKEEIVRITMINVRQMRINCTETFSGLTVIRAFEKQGEFIDSNNEVMDKVELCTIFYMGSNHFFQVRLFFLSNCMFCCSSVLCIYLRGSYTPLTLALLFQ